MQGVLTERPLFDVDCAMIDVQQLGFAYGGHTPVFDHFSWTVASGEAWAVIGPSGCGKTTLLYLLAGLRHPTSGAVTIHGSLVDRPRPQTGLVLQDHGLLPWATVGENVELGFRIRRFYGPDGRHAPRAASLSTAVVQARVAHWLERLGITDQRDKFPAQLSGGQRQRTAIARTLALEPDLLLMDEPFSALDAPTREDLQNLAASLRREASLTSIIVTHNIEEAVFLGEHILVLGRPPNREPLIIDNPSAGQPALRDRPEFARLCAEVRGRLEGQP